MHVYRYRWINVQMYARLHSASPSLTNPTSALVLQPTGPLSTCPFVCWSPGVPPVRADKSGSSCAVAIFLMLPCGLVLTSWGYLEWLLFSWCYHHFSTLSLPIIWSIHGWRWKLFRVCGQMERWKVLHWINDLICIVLWLCIWCCCIHSLLNI